MARSAPGNPQDPWCLPLKGELPSYHEQGPLKEPLDPKVEEAAANYLKFVTENPYSKEVFGTAARKGLDLLMQAGGWKEAVRALRKINVQQRGDHFDQLHGEFFEGLVDADLLAKARDNALHGVRARSDCEYKRIRSSPHPSLKEYLEEAAEQLWKDARKGRALITEDRGGQELEGVVSVPMARVPKMLPDRTLSTKGRVIWDATPVNQTCAKENHPPALQPKHSEMARAILWWKQRYPHARILLSKKDISDAFKWVPVRLEDTRLFAADLPGQAFGVEVPITVIYNTLTFGWTGAPGEFMLYAWIAKLAHMGYAPLAPEWNDGTTFRSLVLMDDTVLIEPEVGVRPWMSVAASEQCTKATLGPHTINPEKDAIEGALEEVKLIWGLVYDTHKGTRSLPAAKLEKASYLLHLPEFDYGSQEVPLKLVQELRGNQQFWLTIMPSLSNFLQASNDLLGPADERGMAVARGTSTKQRRTWIRFWEAVELQRLLVDNRAVWESRFTHPMVEALTVPEMMVFCKENIIWASGDATLEKVAAVDWHGGCAFSEDVHTFEGLIRTYMEEAIGEEAAQGEGEDSGFIISITELLAVVTLAALRAEAWRGKLVLYCGDNQNVIGWLDKRCARHPAATYLLQVLSAIEATNAFRLHGSYLRTYHNITADALTREDAEKVLQEKGLERIVGAKEALTVCLDRGWMRRAMVWAGQADADRCQALRLAERRNSTTRPVPTSLKSLVSLKVLDWSSGLGVYSRELTVFGATVLKREGREDEGLGVWDGTRLNNKSMLTCTLTQCDESAVEELGRGVLHARPQLVWIDVQREGDGKKVENTLKALGYETLLHQVSGRTLKDQVWWRRWVLLADLERTPPAPCQHAEEEPSTEIPKRFDEFWIQGDAEVEAAEGVLHLDPSMPFLGATKPKPCGTLKPLDKGERRLVWSPSRPLPALHRGSWDHGHPQNLLLQVQRKEGPVARPLQPSEAILLLEGRHHQGGDDVERAAEALLAAPRKLAELAGQWAIGVLEENEGEEKDDRVGLCRLKWEDETERVLYQWVRDNPPYEGPECVSRVGGRRGRREDRPDSFYISKALSRLLRHEAGTEEIPISGEGWVKWRDMMKYPPLQRFSPNGIYDAIMINEKQRFVARPDDQQDWWVAAWSGHTIPDVVGPSRSVPSEEVPTLLVHGTYRRNVPHIETGGLRRGRRDIHLQDPRSHARRWRKGLEVKISVDTVRAIELGCRFRVTGNLVWLCDSDIPTEAIITYREWDDLLGGPDQIIGDVGTSQDQKGIWGPDEEELARQKEEGEQPITERVAAAAKDLGQAVSSLTGGQSIVMVPETWEVEVKEQPEASRSPGQQPDLSEEECDWSEDEPEIQVVEALPASSSGAGTAKEDLEEEEKVDKTELLEEAPKRRKILRFGSAQIHILQAVAAADTANWVSLQQCIRAHEFATPGQRTALLDRLEQLAEAREESREGALEALEYHKRQAQDVADLEQAYQEGLDVEMARLERFNPVGPRSSQPLLTNTRMEAELAGGTGIWQARRNQRARERAARHRLAVAERGGNREAAGTLQDVPPDDHGTVIDMTMRDRAQEELREFKRELRAEEPKAAPGPRPHQKDSERRRRLKRQREREKKRTRKAHDDAERDQNHAIAHLVGNPDKHLLGGGFAARSAPGSSQGFMGDVAMVFLALMALKVVISIPRLWGKNSQVAWEQSQGRRVGGRKRKVQFKGEREFPTGPQTSTPFLGGPATAKRLQPAGKTLRFAQVQGSHEWDQEVLTLLLDRYAKTTSTVYRSQYRWWELFCLRRGVDPIRIVTGNSYDREEEQLFLDFIVHSSTNEGKAPGTVKLRLAAVRSHHLTMGLQDPTMRMPRIPLALAGIKRRYGTKERRKPVTPVMLRWIGKHLQFGRSAEASLLWCAVCMGYFFLLRASEYLGVGYVDPNRGLRGCDITLKENGTPCALARIGHADEVSISIRGSKTDIYNRGEARNHFRSGDDLCPVLSTIQLFRNFPQRYGGGMEAQGPLFVSSSGEMIPRQAVTALLEQAARGLNMPEGDFGTHSLRFGGASAIWASYNDSTMVKRWGRWSSDSFQTYIWDARKTADGVSKRMSQVDLTPT